MMNDELKKHFSKMTNLTKVATAEDIYDVVSTFASLVKELKASIDQNIASKKGELSTKVEDALATVDTIKSELVDYFKETKQFSDSNYKTLQDLQSKLDSSISEVKGLIPTLPEMPDMEAYSNEVLSRCEERLIQISARLDEVNTSTNFRDQLEKLEGDERLDKSAIKGIDTLEERLSKIEAGGKGGTVFVGTGSSGGGRIVKSFDLYSQLDGVLKTFSLPAVNRVISVHSSSAPFSFRETTDYIWTSSSITFTSEIDASVTLAIGQTVTIIYSEA